MKRLIILITLSLMLTGCFSDNNNETDLNGGNVEIVPEGVKHTFLTNLDILKLKSSKMTTDEMFNPKKHKCSGIYLENTIDGEMETNTRSFYCFKCNNTNDYNNKNIRMSTYYENYVAYSCEYKMW